MGDGGQREGQGSEGWRWGSRGWRQASGGHALEIIRNILNHV